MDCHLISRFLTKPWEHGDRKLTYVDLDLRTVRTSASKTLFVKPDVFTPRAEAMFCRTFETGLGAWRSRWDGALGIPEIDSGAARAMYLATLLSPPRTTAGRDPTSSSWLNEVAARPPAEQDAVLDGWVSSFWEYKSLAVCRQALPVFFPEAVVFALAVPDPACRTGFGHLLMMAVAPTLLLVLVPRGLDLEVAMSSWVKPGHLQHASMGIAEFSRKVIVPPDLRHYSEAALVKAVEEAQSSSAALLAQVERLRALSLRMHGMVGLATTKNRAGRYLLRDDVSG